MKVNGELKKIFTRDVKGKKGISVCVEHDGEDLWVSCGFDAKIPAEEGDIVEFTAIKDKKWWKVDPADIKVVKSNPPKVKSGGGYNSPERQASIVAQGALTRAIEFLTLAFDTDSLVLGTAKATPAKKYPILEEMVMKKAAEFFDIGMNPDKYFNDEEDDEDDEDDDDFDPVGE